MSFLPFVHVFPFIRINGHLYIFVFTIWSIHLLLVYQSKRLTRYSNQFLVFCLLPNQQQSDRLLPSSTEKTNKTKQQQQKKFVFFWLQSLEKEKEKMSPIKVIMEGEINVYGHTHLNASVPVPLTEIKQVLVWSVLGRVTTREYQMS